MQVINNHLLGGSAFSVDVLLICVLYYGLNQGPLVGQGMGIVWGLLNDASSLGLLGMHALLYALAGYAAGMLRRQLDETKLWTQGIFTLAISLGYSLLYLGLDHLFSGSDRSFSWGTALHPFVNGCLAPVLFWLLHRWSEAWEIFPVVE